MKKLMNLKGMKSLGRTAQKSINGGSAGCVQNCSGQPRRYKGGVCGGTPAILCNCDTPCSGEIVNGNCYICV